MTFTKPTRKPKKLLEREVQKKCVDFARSLGFWARKFSSISQRSVPDYLFGRKYGEEQVAWAEEFKAEGETSTDAQTIEQNLMRAAGWTVIADTGTNGAADVEAFKARLRDIEMFGRPSCTCGHCLDCLRLERS